MEIRALRIEGTYEIRLQPHRDHRGYFMRHYDAQIFREHGLQTEWAQENESRSSVKNTLRGLHFQRPPHAETKLVRAIRGAILDVFVDLRADSPTCGEWDSIELSEEAQNCVYIPRGFAHGFCTLTDDVLVQYKVDNRYAPEHESGIRWNDPELGIDWPVSDPILSERDTRLPFFRDLDTPFR